MGVFCDRLELGSTAALDCWTGQNKGRYHKKRALIPTRLVDPGQYLLLSHYIGFCQSLVVWKEEKSEVVSYKTITQAASYDPVKK